MHMSIARFFARLVIWTATLAFSDANAGETLLHGAGSTMAANYVEASRSSYQATHEVGLQYDAVGSGEGIRRMAAGRVDFALTDIPLTEFELEQLKLTQIPLFYCGVAVVVNLPGVKDGELRLTDAAVSAIFAGEITRWRDPQVMQSNEGVNVPDLPIVVVHRADTSGTSFIFTSFLSGASELWASRFGIGSRLSWPTGRSAQGSSGMLDAVRSQAGAIGYLEYGNALKGDLDTVQLASGRGDFVRASPESFRRALAVRPTENASHYQLLTRSVVAGAWPILATEYGLIEREQRKERGRSAAVRFLDFLASNPTLADFQLVPYDARASGDNP
jgi:phosphate transport system substrate-binding protein